jgi:hypothetical protein
VLAKPAQLEMADLKDRFGNFDGESIGHQQWPCFAFHCKPSYRRTHFKTQAILQHRSKGDDEV